MTGRLLPQLLFPESSPSMDVVLGESFSNRLRFWNVNGIPFGLLSPPNVIGLYFFADRQTIN